MIGSIKERIQEVTGFAVTKIDSLPGGSVGEVYRCEVENGDPLVIKIDRGTTPLLTIEAQMLNYLAQRSNLPVPKVIYADPRLLIIPFIDGESVFSSQTQHHAAELLADLHSISGPQYGFMDNQGQRVDTLIGGLPQPNPPSGSWINFFRDHRLMYMAGEAALSGQLPMETLPRIEKLSGDLSRFIQEPEHPSLIHGDVWTTNILARDGRVVAFLDPAIYFADPEIELAFTTLFGTFNEAFFKRYEEIRPLKPGFFEMRRDIYNLYPLLVHVRLFGGNYVQGVARILKRFGY